MLNFQDLPAVPGTYVLHLSVLRVQRSASVVWGNSIFRSATISTSAVRAAQADCGPGWGGICAATAHGTGTLIICALSLKCKMCSTR